MRRVALAILVLGLLAAGCDGRGGEETTTTTVPSWALDPGAPADDGPNREARDYSTVIAAETWMGWEWRVTAGGPIDVGYLEAEACVGWASRAPAVECSLPTDGEDWAFSFRPDVPVAPIGGPGGELQADVPRGLVLIVRSPDGAWACSGDYQGGESSPSITVEFPSAQSGPYDIWVAAPSEDTSAGGTLTIVTPAASFPTTTTTAGVTQETPASTFPPTTG